MTPTLRGLPCLVANKILPDSVILSNRCQLLASTSHYYVHDYLYNVVYEINKKTHVIRRITGKSLLGRALFKAAIGDTIGYAKRQAQRDILDCFGKSATFIEGISIVDDKLYLQLTYSIPRQVLQGGKPVTELTPYPLLATFGQYNHILDYSLRVGPPQYYPLSRKIYAVDAHNLIVPIAAKRVDNNLLYSAARYEIGKSGLRYIEPLLQLPEIYRTHKLYYNFASICISYPWAAHGLDNRVINLLTKKSILLPFDNKQLNFNLASMEAFVPNDIVGLSKSISGLRILVNHTSAKKEPEFYIYYYDSKSKKISQTRVPTINNVVSDFSVDEHGKFIALTDKHEVISL